MSRKSRFKLGDKVRMTGTAVKERSEGGITYVRADLPQKNYYKSPKIFEEGIVVGVRVVSNGSIETEYSDDLFGGGRYTYFSPDSAQKVWLVAFDLQMKPVICFDDQLRLVGETEPLWTHLEIKCSLCNMTSPPQEGVAISDHKWLEEHFGEVHNTKTFTYTTRLHSTL